MWDAGPIRNRTRWALPPRFLAFETMTSDRSRHSGPSTARQWPAALFAYLVGAGNFPAALEDEDRATAALREARAAESQLRRWLAPKRPA